MKKVKKTKHERNEKMKSVRKKVKNMKLPLKKRKNTEHVTSESRQAEEKISRALQEWQTTFDATNDAMWILDKDQRILRSNKTAERIFQRSNKELIGKHCWEIVHGTKQSIPECPVLRAKKSLHREHMNLQIGKGWFEVIVDPILDAAGRYDGAVHIVSDITERKRAEKELEWKTAFLEAQVNSSFDGILIVDNHGKKILQNQRCIDLWKIPQNIVELHDDAVQVQYVMNRTKYPEQFVEKVTHLYAHPLEISHDEIEFKDGMFLDRYSAPVLGQDGTNYGRVWTFHDITDHKMAEETILKERALLRTLIDNLPVGVFVKDKKYRKTIVNPLHSKEIIGHLKYLGVNSEIDILGKTDFEVFPKELAQKFFEEDQNVIGGGSLVLNEEGLGYSEEGNELCLLVSKIPLRDNNGEIIGMVGVANDITERKLAEEALRENKEKYYNLYRNASLGIFHSTFEGRFIDMNPALAKMLGYDSPEEAVDCITNIAEQVYAEPPKHDDVANAVLKSGGEIRIENHYRRRDGSKWFGMLNMRIVASQKDSIGYYEGFVEDITERKRATDTLKENEEKYRNLFNNAEVGMFRTRLDGSEILEFNEKYLKILQYTREEIVGKPSVNIWADEREREKMVQMLKAEDHVTDLEFDLLNKQGEVKRCITSLRLYRDTEILEGSIIDITERKLAEWKLQESEERFRRIFEDHAAVKLLINPDSGKIIDANKSASAYYGWSCEELRRMNIEQINTLTPDEVKKEMEKALSQKRIQFEFKHRRKDGSIRDVEVFSSKILIGNKNVLHSIVHDITERKLAEETLRESEDRFRMMFESTPIAINITHGTEITYANPSYLQMFGLSTFDELKRFAPLELFAPEWRSTVLENIDRRSKGLSVLDHYEVECLRSDGIKFPIVMYLTKIVFSDGPATVGFILDITDRKYAEIELKKSQQIYQSIFENTGNATMIVDENTAILLANSECLAATGYSPENLVGTSWTKYVAPNDLEMMKRNSQLRLQDSANAPNRYDVHLVNARGEIRNTTLTIGLIPELHQFVVSMLDITDRIRAEEDLQESEIRFRSLYENATIGLYRTTPDGTILLANPTLEKMLGYASFQELAERNLEQDGFEPTYQRKEFLEKIERDGMVNGLESKWIRRDGKVIDVRESARAIRDPQGKSLYYDGTVEDITEHKHLEEGLRNVQKLEGLGTLAGGIAHDFNNILGIILAYTSSIKKFKDDPKNLDLATETITKAVVRGKTLVQQILTFARKTDTSFGAVNMNDVAMEIVTMIYEMFPKTIVCSQNFDKSLPYINADRSQLHQILLNLCVNARDAMPNGGVLTLKTRMESAGSLRVSHMDADADSYVCLEVSDTGEGMAEETRKRIFEPFFTTKGIGKGTGLGLAVVFGIIQTHKGFIDVESELGTGTTFRIYLPVTDVVKPVNEKEEELLEEIQGGTETLLVVEDEEMLAIPLQMALVDKGYKVLVAGDGFAALKIYQERKNDIALVLTDLGLPTISGLEVCNQIKQINPNVRVILATGFLDPEVKAKFLKAGIEHFLYKPYDLSKVLKEIRIVLDGK